MATSALKNEIHALIDNMPEKNLAALRPLLSVLSEPLYAIETDLTSEEKTLINEGVKEYHDNPDSFIPLRELKNIN